MIKIPWLKNRFSSKWIGPLVLIITVFVVSRLIFFYAGVRFDASPLVWIWQFIDRDLLQNNLLQSVYYLHGQAPLFNVFLGIILKIFPGDEEVAFSLIYKALGLMLAISMFLLMTKLRVNQWVSLLLTIGFIVSPSCILYENWLFYTYPIAFFICLAPLMLHKFLTSDRLLYAVCFFAMLTLLVLTRSVFHLLWFLLCGVILLAYQRKNWKRVTLALLVPLVLASALYIKNLVLFGSFTSSTWLGMSLAKMTTFALSEDERKMLASQGTISEVSLIRPFSDFAAYEPYMSTQDSTGIPILDRETKALGPRTFDTNYNNIGFVDISKLYLKDALSVLRLHPDAYLQSVLISFSIYFYPSSKYQFLAANRNRIRSLDKFYNRLFYGQLLPTRPESGKRRSEQSFAMRFAERLSNIGIFLVAGILLVLIYGRRLLLRSLSKKPIDSPFALTMLFMHVNIAYVTLVGNCVEIGENHRFRFTIDPLMVVLLGLALNGIIKMRQGDAAQS